MMPCSADNYSHCSFISFFSPHPAPALGVAAGLGKLRWHLNRDSSSLRASHFLLFLMIRISNDPVSGCYGSRLHLDQ